MHRVKSSPPPRNSLEVEKSTTEEGPLKEDTTDLSILTKHHSLSATSQTHGEPRSRLDISSCHPSSPSSGPQHSLGIGLTVPSLSQRLRLNHRRSHIYDIRSAWLGDVGMDITIVGMSKRSYSEGSLYKIPLTKTWYICLQDEKWSCKLSRNVIHKIQAKQYDSDSYVRKRGKGEVLAMEKRNPEKPRLEVKRVMEEKDIDFLVTVWVARVAFDAMNAAKEPMSWERFVTITSMKSKGKRLGAFVMADFAAC